MNLTQRGQKFCDLWVGALLDLDVQTIEAACRQTLRTCKFFPTPADVYQHVTEARKTRVALEGKIAWDQVLDHCRRHVWPDGGKFGPPLPPAIDFAVRSAGGLAIIATCSGRELLFCESKFLDAFAKWSEESSTLMPLPDGPVKNALAGVAAAKQLPAPYSTARAHGEKYRRSLAASRVVELAKTEMWTSPAARDRALESLSERETNPDLIEKIQRDKARLAEWERNHK